MKRQTELTDAARLIRIAAFLWIGYLTALAIINLSLGEPRRVPFQIIYYYLLLGLVALICLSLAYWSGAQRRLGSAFIPLIIILVTVMPVIITWQIRYFIPPTPILSPESSVMWTIPFLFVSFLLVAWQYKWQHMLFLILGTTLLNLGIIWSFPAPGPSPIRGAITITLIQTVIFLAMGFSISYLISRLRKQQQSLEEANTRLANYASTLEQLATSQERNRLARELHDTLAHTLSGLSVQLEAIKAYWEVDPQAARSTLDKSLASARSGLEETRRALRALRASPLEDMGLAPAFRKMVEDSVAHAGLALDLSIADKLPALPHEVEQCIYRVAQEAVTNVLNHARAKNIAVSLEYIEGKVKLTVRDDGVGFDPEKSNGTTHFGLTGMRERAQLVGGELNFNSRPGSGTTIELTI